MAEAVRQNEAEKPSKKTLPEERPEPVSRAALSDRASLPATKKEVPPAGEGSGPARPLSAKERSGLKADKERLEGQIKTLADLMAKDHSEGQMRGALLGNAKDDVERADIERMDKAELTKRLREELGAKREAVEAALRDTVAKLAQPKERTSAKAAKKPTLPAIDNLEAAGVTSSVQPKSPVDRRAVDRALANRLDRPLPGKGKSLREELASRGVRIAELSDVEASALAKSLGVEEGVLPRAKGELENIKGETGKRVDNAYKLAAARSIREALAAKVKGTTKLRGDLQEIAGFLGMDPAEARRKAYASDAAYIEAVRDALQAKYGKASELVQGIHKSDLSPSELSHAVEVLGGKQPGGFRFREQSEVATGAKRAAVADRLPTKDKPLPAPEAPKRTGRTEKVLEEVQAPKAAASFMERLSLTRDNASSKVAGLLSSLGEGRSRVPQVMRALQQDGALRKEFEQLIAGAIGGRHKAGGKVSDRKLEQLADSLEAYASALREGVDSAQAKAAELSGATETGYEGQYNKAAAEAGEMQDVELAAVRDAELADAVEALKNVERAEKAIKRFREDRVPEGKDVARTPRIDHLIAAIAELEAADIAAVVGMQSTLSEDAQRALREAAVLSAAVHALSDGDIDPNRIAEDIAASTFMRSISPEFLGVEGEAGAKGGEAPTTAPKREQVPSLADVWPTKKEAPKKGEPATPLQDVTPAQAIGALTNHIKQYRNAITSIVRGKVSRALGVDPVQFQVWREWIVERLQSDNADRRRLALIELHEVIGENVDLATLSAVEALLNEGELSPERAERLVHGGISANTSGVSTQRVLERNEQELSDFSFFNALRRAMAYFRTPVHFGHKKEQSAAGGLVYGDGWRRKKGEESIFSSHSVYAIDFETFFDIKGGYSLTSMPVEDYIADPRFKIHGMSVTDQDGNTRYLESEADIKAFLDEAKSGDRPVALVAHNSPFDSRVMAARFGYEPDLWVNTVEISVMARSRHGQQVSHRLEHVATSIGMHKPKEALEETSGKRDLKAELTSEQYQAFVDYAKGDANITMEFLRQNEPSINFARESTEAQRFDRGLAPLSAVPQSHMSFGWRNNNSSDAARSSLTTVQLGGRNLIEIPIRYTGWESSQIRLFDAIALANYSQRGEARATSAAQAARNLMAGLSRLAQGPESTVENGFDPGMQSLELYVPHDDVVIYLDPAKGPVTFGEAIKDVRGMRSRDDTMRAADRTLNQARERVTALTSKFVTLAEKVAAQMMAEQHTASAERAEALDIWSRRLMGETIRDADVEALAAEHGHNLKELNKQLDKIGADTVLPKAHKGAKNPEAYRQEGDQLRLADLFNEFLTNLGEIKAASSVRQDLVNLGTQTQDRNPEQEARQALADARNEEILSKNPNADPIRPDNIPQHDVDSYMRVGQRDEGTVNEGWSTQRVALDDSGALTTEGVEQVGVDGLETLFRAQNEQAARNALAAAKNAENEAGGKQEAVVRPEDITPAEVNRYLESQRPSRSRMFDREEPALAPKAKPGSVRYTYDPKDRKVWEGAPNFQDRSRLEGSAKARVVRFLTRLKEMNVPLGNVTLFARSAIEREIRETKDAGLRQALERAAAVGGSAYVVHNGRAYILIDRDSTDVDGWILDLAHELGHMVKDRLWGQLLDSDRDALVNDFNTAMEAAGKDARATKSDDFLLHEWFADQFAAAALEATHRREQGRLSDILEKLEADKDREVGRNAVVRTTVKMLEALRRIWKAVSESVTVTKGFGTFANNLFRGEYQGKADLQAGDATVRRAADSLAGNQALNRAQLAVNKAKALFNQGVAPTARALMGTAIGQMEAIDKGLAKMLYQRANSDSRGARSYEQLNNALGARMIAEKDRFIAELSKGLPKKQQKQAIQEALADAFDGSPKTENGKKARKWLDGIAALAQREGLRTVQLESGFPVVVFDREVVERRREEFVTQMKDRMKISAREASELFLGIVEGVGSLEGAIAPGLPVGMHTSTQSILRSIPYAELREAGWLLGEHEAAVQHWLGGMAKRTAWEKTFGGFVVGNPSSLAFQVFGVDDRSGKRLEKAGLLNDDGLVFSANAKFNEGLDRIRKDQGQPAVDKFVRLLDGVMGRIGADIPQGIRQAQDMTTAVVNTQVLGFSGIASIPELATAFVRAGGKVGLRDLAFSIQEGKRLAEAYGHVLSDSTQRIVWQQTGEQYQTPTAQKINFWLFKLNMNQWITNMSRTIAVGVGAQYLMKAAAEGDTAALARLNIDAETVKLWARYGRQAPSIAQDARMYEINSQVADAISQFVSEATVSPSRFQATAWGNNPAFKLLWHLKAFLWAYGDTIIGGIWRDMNRRYKSLDGPAFNKAVYAAAPMLIYGLAVMPLAAAALELRDWIRRLNGTRVEDRSASQYVADVFDRAGGLGPLAFAAGAYEAQNEYGVSFFGSLSPTFGKVDMMFSDYKKDGQIDAAELKWKARQLIPVWSQNKGLPLPWE